MCDTLVALPAVTANGSTVLAKNSDREPDEAQAITLLPRQTWQSKTCQTTFIGIPQAAETYACILSRPFQMWGAEMGVNEWGVAIGNEAVFTRVKIKKQNTGLTGMDMLRLALERTKTAREALHCIINLLETYGQDACGGYRNRSFYYHNSFLIADAREAYVLETADRHWAYGQVRAYHTISNRLSIGADADVVSEQAASFARAKGWWNGRQPFDFSRAFSDWLYTTVGRGKVRQACTTGLLATHQGQITAAHCFDFLATHHLPHPQFKPSKATTADICMHATGLLNPSRTTGSMVAEISTDKSPTVWLTGTSNPCVSVFIPFFFGAQVPEHLLTPAAAPDGSLWWQAEELQRHINVDYRKRRALIEPERQHVQSVILEKYRQYPPEKLPNLTGEALQMVQQWIQDCLKKI
ncbi:C69 family dipeptidase [Rhodoflexus caldus]|uniref:C69 family dipeptidase n=1 Tax=Rhodoflexus caldus TaxID=2891236 RepID=UPI002029B51D|nr:C69 family dipeptidase [Rhodoflexus caldus]